MNDEKLKPTKARIFIIDDSRTGLTFIKQSLEDAGYVVQGFESPLGISQELIRRRPDLVLLDVMMPSINGDNMCKLIRSLNGGQDIRIVLYSSKPVAELSSLAAECGADGYIVKTSDPRAAIAEVRAQLGRPRSPLGLPSRRTPLRK